MRIGFASTEWLRQADGSFRGGGTLHYRFRLPAQRLAMAGHDVAIGDLVRPKNQPRLFVRRINGPRDRLFPCDVVVLQRYMNAELPGHIAKARADGQVVLNDVDDYFDGLPESNRAFWTTHPDPMTRARGKLRFDWDRDPTRQEVRAHLRSCEGCREAPRENREHYREILRASDAILVSTAFLEERLASLAPTHLLRNALDLDTWRRQPVNGDVRAPVVTWYGALGFRASGDFDILRDVLPSFLRADRGRTFVHGGSTGMEDYLRMLTRFGLIGMETQAGARPGVSIERVHELLDGADVGVVPLEACEFNEAKSSLKGMEMAAAGVPFVTSPTREYEWFDQGIIARTTQEWRDALESLCDPQLRVTLADRARERVENIGIDRTWPAWLTTIEGIVQRR